MGGWDLERKGGGGGLVKQVGVGTLALPVLTVGHGGQEPVLGPAGGMLGLSGLGTAMLG